MNLVEGSADARVWVRNTGHRDARDINFLALLGDLTNAFAHQRRVIDASFASNHQVGISEVYQKKRQRRRPRMMEVSKQTTLADNQAES